METARCAPSLTPGSWPSQDLQRCSCHRMEHQAGSNGAEADFKGMTGSRASFLHGASAGRARPLPKKHDRGKKRPKPEQAAAPTQLDPGHPAAGAHEW